MPASDRPPDRPPPLKGWPPPPNQVQPLERYEPYLPHDKRVEPEVTPIRLLEGRTQGPGRLGDLMRAARRKAAP